MRIVAVLFVLIGAIVPHFTILHGSLWGYAIFWEVMAAMCFIFAYGAVALAVVLPVKVRAHGVAKFAQSGADLLSRASETDHVEFAEDLRQSMPMLVRAAQFVERLHYPSAFFMFTHRQRIAQGAYARSFLLILADPAFCATAVRKIPWQAARTLKDLAKGELHARSAEEFVRQLAQQAIINDDGMMEREIGYHGFAAAPLLSEALFSDPFIVSVYDPYKSISLAQDDFSGRQLKRLNSAIERSYEALLEKRFGDARTTHGLRRTYQSVFSQVWRYRKSGSENYGFPPEMHSAVKQTINAAHSLLKATGDREYAYLFVKNEKDHRHDLLEDFVDIVYEAMLAISNDFEGPGNSFWMIAIGSVGHVFPSIGDAPDGLNPFQQRLLVKMKKKISDNMQGYYPALARMLLALRSARTREKLGRKTGQPPTSCSTCSIWSSWTFRNSKAKEPERLPDYLPANVTYDDATRTLNHTYRDGSQRATQLRTLTLASVDLFALAIRSPREAAIDELRWLGLRRYHRYQDGLGPARLRGIRPGAHGT